MIVIMCRVMLMNVVVFGRMIVMHKFILLCIACRKHFQLKRKFFSNKFLEHIRESFYIHLENLRTFNRYFVFNLKLWSKLKAYFEKCTYSLLLVCNFPSYHKRIRSEERR